MENAIDPFRLLPDRLIQFPRDQDSFLPSCLHLGEIEEEEVFISGAAGWSVAENEGPLSCCRHHHHHDSDDDAVPQMSRQKKALRMKYLEILDGFCWGSVNGTRFVVNLIGVGGAKKASRLPLT